MLIKDIKIINEKNYEIIVNDVLYISVMCLPEREEEFVIGFLFFEGFIKSMDDIDNIDVADGKINVGLKNKDITINREGKKTLTTGCGKAITNVDLSNPTPCKRIDTGFKFEAKKIIELMKEFNNKSELFLETGGVHACAIAEDSLIVFAEDVGRHNAFDKVVGYCLKNNIDVSQKILLTSGRISSEMMAKAIRSKIPIIISRSAPTDYAIKLAEKYFITLIGFARANRFNVYTFAERIIINSKCSER